MPLKVLRTGPTKQSPEKEPEQTAGRLAGAMALHGVVALRVKVTLEDPLAQLPMDYVTE